MGGRSCGNCRYFEYKEFMRDYPTGFRRVRVAWCRAFGRPIDNAGAAITCPMYEPMERSKERQVSLTDFLG